MHPRIYSKVDAPSTHTETGITDDMNTARGAKGSARELKTGTPFQLRPTGQYRLSATVSRRRSARAPARHCRSPTAVRRRKMSNRVRDAVPFSPRIPRTTQSARMRARMPATCGSTSRCTRSHPFERRDHFRGARPHGDGLMGGAVGRARYEGGRPSRGDWGRHRRRRSGPGSPTGSCTRSSRRSNRVGSCFSHGDLLHACPL
jgi:hypothetical protein